MVDMWPSIRELERMTTELGFQNVEILSSTQLESRGVMDCSVRGMELETVEKRVIYAFLNQKKAQPKPMPS